MARAIISDHLEDLWQKQLMIIHNGLNTFGAVSFEVHSELYDNCSTTGCRLVLYIIQRIRSDRQLFKEQNHTRLTATHIYHPLRTKTSFFFQLYRQFGNIPQLQFQNLFTLLEQLSIERRQINWT